MQAAGSVDHPLPPQSDAGGRGRVTGGWVRIIVGRAGSLVGWVEIQMGCVMSQWVGGVTGEQGSPTDSTQGSPTDSTQGSPTDSTQGSPTDSTQGIPTDSTQGIVLLTQHG